MNDLTEVDLEAMEKRVSHARKVLYSPSDVIIPTLYHDVDALIAALREARALIAAEVEEVGWLKEIAIRAGYDLDARAVCRKTGFQNCTQCPRLECCDNQSRFSKYEIAMGERRKSAEVERVKRLEKVAEAARKVCSVCGRHGCGSDYRNCWYVSEAGFLSRCAVGAALAELDAGEGSC